MLLSSYQDVCGIEHLYISLFILMDRLANHRETLTGHWKIAIRRGMGGKEKSDLTMKPLHILYIPNLYI